MPDIRTRARDLADIPAVEVITRAAVMLMSATAAHLGLSSPDPDTSDHRDLDEARRLITALAGYVNSGCMGDTKMILSAGFKLQKQPEPISTLDAPRGATVRRTEYVSQLEITWARVPGATIYEVEEEVGGADGSSHWQRVSLTTRPKLVVDGCRTNEFHNFRVCAVGTQVQSPYAFAFYNAAI